MSDPSSVAAFKQKSQAGKAVELPSGCTARLRRPGIQLFMKNGTIPNSLMPIIQKAISTDKTPSLAELADDPQKISDLLMLMDKVSLFAFIEPEVHEVPENETDRDENLLYLDEIDATDKVFVYQYAVGGAADLETFRKQQAEYMGAVPGSEDLADQAQ